MKYQLDYSSHFPTVKDAPGRQRKAIKILRVIADHLGREDLQGLTCLDMGCSVGIISNSLARAGARVLGLDIDREAVCQAAPHAPGAAFVIGDVGASPFPDSFFDLIVCSQVYEHSPSLTLLVRELERLLKPGGICFFSGPNRWAVIEEHYHLPFLSWLPRRWANVYVRCLGRAQEYYEHPCSAGELRAALRRFSVHDYTASLLADPGRFALKDELGPLGPMVSHVPARLWRRLGGLVPNFNWILVRDDS
jgi:SAM-dependent methyltransferase